VTPGRCSIGAVFHQIGPYHETRLNAAASKAEIAGIEWTGKEAYPWGGSKSSPTYRKVSLFPEGDVARHEIRRQSQALGAALNELDPAVVAVNGWNDFGSLVTIQWCLRQRRPMVVMSESSRHDEARRFDKEMMKRRLVGIFSSGLVGGRLHREYLHELGMPEERIFTGYDAVDNGYFARGANEVRSKKDEVRRKYQLPESYFLASARFIEKKNLPALIRGYARYRTEVRTQKEEGRTTAVEPWDLVILGDGPLRESVESQLLTLNLRSHVHLPGFRQYDELPAYYGLAKAFIHASTTEQWGLVVNEAMASDLPVLVSSRCGCAPELVENGRNGFTFDPARTEEIARVMTEITRLSPEELATMGEASERIIQQWGPERFANGLIEAAEVALNSGPPACRLRDRFLLEMLLRR
jgi:1,2-diacylglycerol 3-alpha-glucosyltransferase